MLRQVDGGRKGLRLLVPGPGLGPSRKGRFSSQGQRHARSVDFQPAQLVHSPSQQGWQETIRGWPEFSRRTGALRLESRPVSALSLWDFSRICHLYERRPVGCLRHLSRRRAVAEQGGRERASTTFLCAIVPCLASLVARWQADRLL